MNVNQKLLSLEKVTGYPVSPDVYEGRKDCYIVFTYEDERPSFFADNEEETETAWLQVTLYTPPFYDYMADKKNIKKALKTMGFNIESIQSWVDSVTTERKRCTVFNVNITGPENKED